MNEKIVNFIDKIYLKTKGPLKELIFGEFMIVASAKFPMIPRFFTKMVVRWALNKTAYPMIDASYREIGYQIEVKNGEILLKKIQNASTPSDWDNLSNSV